MLNTPTKIVTGAIPKYRQLLQILRNSILSEELLPGAQIPTEEELSAAYGVSRGTVRKAIAQLEAEGLIRTEQGVGSFVRTAHPNAIPFRFADDQHLLPHPEGTLTYEVMAQEVLPAQMDEAERLRIAPGTHVIHVVRRQLLDDKVFAYTVRYLPESLCPPLLHADLAHGSIHEVLINHSELPLLRAEMEIEAHFVTEEEAELLDAQAGDTAIVINRVTYTAPNRPAVWYRAWFKNEFYMGIYANSTNKRDS